jgi:alpha-amylase/alpha-mannosidase (GH57 family)
MQVFSQTIPPFLQRNYGTCLFFTQYLNKEDISTMKNRSFINQHQPRSTQISKKVYACMEGKPETPQQQKICVETKLNKEDGDFYLGYSQGIMAIRASEPNMNEIKSKFRMLCSDIVY